jgi:hypothetical protein
MSQPRLQYFLAIIAFLALSRLLPHPPNVSVMTAMALFGGAYFSNRSLALAVTLSAMLLSDAVLGFHSLMWVVYGSFALVVLMGSVASRFREKISAMAGLALGSSILFFFTTNTAVWAFHDTYPHTLEGLGMCYVAALPFFQNSLISDVLFTVVLFSAVNAWQRQANPLRVAA